MTRYLVTGASGFVGSHLVRHLLTNTDAHLILPVSFRHKGNADRLTVALQDHPEWWQRVDVIYHDLLGPFSTTQVERIGHVDAIFNVASESHVDRSITEPGPFIQNNVHLMVNMLELARAIKPDKFIQISTDEVYGPAPVGHDHQEWSTILPSNPYSASKACQEAIGISYWRTYGVPLIVTNSMNIIGETQDPEKFVTKTIKAILNDEPVTVHVDTDGTPGSRFYLHARNQSDALLFVAKQVDARMYPECERPERLNVVGDLEVHNEDMALMIAHVLGKTVTISKESFHASRPGHDLRYALDGSKLASYGWKAPISFQESLERTVNWTLAHPEWLA